MRLDIVSLQFVIVRQSIRCAGPKSYGMKFALTPIYQILDPRAGVRQAA
jgi:hypothetical protein